MIWPGAGGRRPSLRASTFSDFFTRLADPVDLEAEHVLVAESQRWVWLVEQGAMDLFAAILEDGQPKGRWTPLCRLDAGAMFVLGAPGGPQHHVLARPAPGSQVSRMSLEALEPLTGDPGRGERASGLSPSEFALTVYELVAGIDATIIALSDSLRDALPPRKFVALEPTLGSPLPEGSIGRSVSGVMWLKILAGSVTTGEGGTPGKFNTGSELCITERDWIVARDASVLQARTSLELLRDGSLWGAMLLQASRTGYAIDRRIEKLVMEESERLGLLREKTKEVRRRSSKAFGSILVESIDRRSDQDMAPDLQEYGAAKIVADRMGIRLRVPGLAEAGASSQEIVADIASRSGVRTRSVRLIMSWWKQDLGPLIGYRRHEPGAVALLRRPHGYVLADGNRVQTVDAEIAATLKIEATVLYRPLPAGVRGTGPLLRFGLAGSKRDIVRFLWVGLAVAVLGLLVPVLTGTVLGTWVVSGRRDLVVQGALLVMASGFVSGALTFVQNMAVLRLEGRIDYTLQAAVWDRLLALPISFFSKYSAAELGTVALGISSIRETLSAVTTAAAVGLLVGVSNLVLLFVYSVPLALVALAMVTVSFGVSLWFGKRAVRVQRLVYRAEQKISARSFQLLSGIATLRIAAAEERAFAQWAHDYGTSLSLSIRVRRSQAAITTFSAGFTVFVNAVIFLLVAGPLRRRISIAEFLAFFTAFNVLMGSVVQFASAALAAVAVIPMFEDLDPIVQCEPEDTSGAMPGDLAGRIDVRNVSFQYGRDAPVVLDSVSFTVKPGEFVALVGATGSGKSTILRLLLGFEQPVSGSILYDGQDLRRLDLAAVRRQCGVVLQNGALLAGDIGTNIIGGSGRSMEDAWAAAEMAGIAADIQQLPMGMMTMLPEGAGSLSGGQRQRLAIARALVSSPRILMFDEATSALDNVAQNVVTESTHKLNATRIAVAHRLSTIRKADRIIVLESGRVVETGRYDQLLDNPNGVFAKLVRKQVDVQETPTSAGP